MCHGDVVDDRRGECAALGPPIRCNERKVPSPIQDRQLSKIDLADAKLHRLTGSDADEGLDEVMLTVAFDAGDADDFAFVHDEVDRSQLGARAGDACLEAAHPKHRSTVFERCAL